MSFHKGSLNLCFLIAEPTLRRGPDRETAPHAIRRRDEGRCRGSPLPWSWEGRILEKEGQTEEAIGAFEAGLALQGDHFRCLTGLINVLVAVGKNERAYEVGRTTAGSMTSLDSTSRPRR